MKRLDYLEQGDYIEWLEQQLEDLSTQGQYTRCDDCGRYALTDEMKNVDTEWYCDKCDDGIQKCCECGEYFFQENMAECDCSGTMHYYCDTCWDAYGCEECKKTQHMWDNADWLVKDEKIAQQIAMDLDQKEVENDNA